MEVIQLLNVLRRRWLLIVIPTLVVAAIAVITAKPPGVSYSTGMRFTAGQRETPAASPQGYDPNFYRWQTSEYIVAGLRDWVRSAAFATAVSEELAKRELEIPPAALLGHLAADSSQTLLAVYVQWPDRLQTQAIAEAAVTVLQERNGDAFPQLGGQAAEVVPLDTPVILPVIETQGPGLQTRLQVPFRIALGLVTGLVLAFVADYFDSTIRDRRELEAMGLVVIGEIPRGRSKTPRHVDR
jgi:capsular polysaccharide biosynthesis protein